MCTGRSPFRASTIMGVIRRVCEDEPRPIREVNPDVPEWLCAIVERLLSKNPANRFSSADEVASLLAGSLAHVHQPLTVPLPESVSHSDVSVPVEVPAPKETVQPQVARGTSSLIDEEPVTVATPEPLAQAAIDAVREKLRLVAPKLKWAAMLNVFLFLAFLGFVASRHTGEVDDVSGLVFAGLIGAAIMFHGSRRLSRGDSLGWPTLAAVCCFLSVPGWPLGLPAAIRI